MFPRKFADKYPYLLSNPPTALRNLENIEKPTGPRTASTGSQKRRGKREWELVYK
jgi:hypothetical protein